jgi:hypothetical protein
MVENINDVIAALDSIVDRARDEQSRLGYFAALYRRVTRRVRDGIAQGRFQDGPRMEHLDVVFAGRYLTALDRFRAGQDPGRSWHVAFTAAANPLPLVLQQLLAGMNAHINFDLGIAAAEVSAVKADFDKINNVLAEEVAGVEQALAEISPLIGLLERAGLRTETKIINFNLSKARDLSWFTAERLMAAPPALKELNIEGLDVPVAALGVAILHPPPACALQLAQIRAVECNDVRRVLDVLASGGAREASI